MNQDYANFLKLEMAKVLAENDKLRERYEQAMSLLMERGQEIEQLKKENQRLKLDVTRAMLGHKAQAKDEAPVFLPIGRVQ